VKVIETRVKALVQWCLIIDDYVYIL